MLVVTLLLAAVGFGLLVVALMTGSVAWAWASIAVCVIGAVVLLASVLAGRRGGNGGAGTRRVRSPGIGGRADERAGDRTSSEGTEHRHMRSHETTSASGTGAVGPNASDPDDREADAMSAGTVGDAGSDDPVARDDRG